MRKMAGLIKLLILGGIFFSMYSILEVIGAILDFQYKPDHLYSLLALTLLGFVISIFCTKFNIPFIRFILFALFFILIIGLWFWFISTRSSDPSQIYWQVLKGGLFIVLGACINKGVKFFEYFGSLWPGLLFILGPLMISELFLRIKFLEKRLLLLSILFILFVIFKDWLEQTSFLFKERGVELPEVRKKIIRRGLLTAVCLFGLILGIINLKGFIWLIICSFTDWLYKFVAWLISLIPKHKQGSLPPEGFGFIPFDPHPSPYPLVVFLLYFVISFIGLSLLFLVASRAGKVLKRLAGRIFRWFLGLFIYEKKLDCESMDEFTDIVEEADKNIRRPSGRKFSIAAMLQGLEDESDPIRRVRICYRIIVILLMEHILDISNTDTTGDIYKKATMTMRMPEQIELLRKATNLYDKVRYGNEIPDDCEVENIKLFAFRQAKRNEL